MWKSIFSGTCLLLAFAGSSLAEEPTARVERNLPAYYPGSFDKTGMLQEVQPGALMVDALVIPVAPYLTVHTPETEHATVHNLRPQQEVGLRLERIGNRARIVEVWALPPGSIQRD